MSGRPAAFLDRDGVLNAARVVDGRPYPPSSMGELVVLPGVAEACARLKAVGVALVVVTNQPDLARGTGDVGTVEAINRALSSALALDEIVVCPHDDADGCSCRKPAPGMLLDAARRLDLDLDASVLVGDRWRDVEAGRRAGVATVFVDRHYDEPAPDAPDLVVDELIDAVPFILERARQEQRCP